MSNPGRELPAGRELDALVAEKVMQVSVCKCPSEGDLRISAFGVDSKGWFKGCERCRKEHPRRYSEDIAAAWEVVEKLKGGFSLDTDHGKPASWCVNWIVVGETPKHVVAHGDTAPLAICLAALKAVGASRN